MPNQNKQSILAVPLWLEIAYTQYGVTEIPGSESNTKIGEYLLSVGMEPDDEIPWCSGSLNWTMLQANIEGTNKANARSWLNWGIKLDKPRLGCVVILWRISRQSRFGHCGLLVGISVERWKGSHGYYEGVPYIYLLGGNQSNMYKVSKFPELRVLEYRWPSPQMLGE